MLLHWFECVLSWPMSVIGHLQQANNLFSSRTRAIPGNPEPSGLYLQQLNSCSWGCECDQLVFIFIFLLLSWGWSEFVCYIFYFHPSFEEFISHFSFSSLPSTFKLDLCFAYYCRLRCWLSIFLCFKMNNLLVFWSQFGLYII